MDSNISPDNTWDFDLIISHEIWGSELLADRDPNFGYFHEGPEATAVIPQHGSGLQPVDIWPAFDVSVATALDVTSGASEALEATTVADSQIVAIEINPATPKTPLMAISQLTSLDITPATPKSPLMTISWVAAVDISPTTPKAPLMAISQLTSLDITPATPKSPLMTISWVAAVDISPTTPKAPLMAISQLTSLDITPATPKSPLMTISCVNTLFDYEPCGDGEAVESCSKRQGPTVDVFHTKTSIITDINHGLPIIIDDTDDETTEPEGKPGTKSLVYTAQGSDSSSCRRNFRKRPRAVQEGEIHWAQPEYKKKLLHDLRSAFYQHESLWIQVRELPEAIGDAKVKEHDALVQGFGKTCRDCEAVSIEDTCMLRESYIDLMNHLLTVMSRAKDMGMIKKLGKYVDDIREHAMIVSSIYEYQAGEDDSRDGTYRPSKKRRSGHSGDRCYF
ncbi:uncharacterized protein EKO05_0005347 [Ascochyta rabiei]|uniref:uncharacterized protein n=1 Tax=Didymella rabiei TaxID=5454 RepID=UPI0019005639|nr:uncharacterized protein EKO05_0005347 [Ascochyta rabiei]UPX14876.1 hypothetical protein EKO05_0005347 [Ascochyta rabiei]